MKRRYDNKNRRMRKKLRLGEFQVLGFEMNCTIRNSFPGSEEMSIEEYADDFFDYLIDGVEKRGFVCGGGCSVKEGESIEVSLFLNKLEPLATHERHLSKRRREVGASKSDLETISKWLDNLAKEGRLTSYNVGPLVDSWYI